MATLAHDIPLKPIASQLVDRIVGPDASESKEGKGPLADAVKEMTVSLEGLLNPETWSLPGWNTSHVPSSSQHNAETIGQLDLSLALLSRYRNSLQPFYRLSPDVLILIFSELQEDQWNPLDHNFGAYRYMAITKVCHSWRQVALNAPILWRQLSTRYPTAATTALERSADAGVCFVIPHGYEEGDKTAALVKALAAQIHRLRWLYIPSTMLKTSDGNPDPRLTPLIENPAPMLEILETIKVRGEGESRPLPTMFKGKTPLLNRLRVHYLYPQLNSLNMSCIKFLSFCGKKRVTLSIPVSSLVDILEKCPRLEVLKIEKVTWQSAADEDKRKVKLDHLRYLELGRASGSVVADIVGRIDAPEFSMKLKVWLDRYEDNKFYMGVPQEHELDFAHPLRDVRKLYVQFLNGYEGICIYGATKTYPFEIHGLLEDSTISNLGDMDNIAGTVFQSIVRAFDFANIEEFALSEMRTHSRWTGFTKKVWGDLFKRAPNLKSFYITTDASYDEGFARAILAALVTPDERSGRLHCPALENLFVSGDKTWSSLQCYVMAEERSKAGTPLKRVSMRLPHYASFSDPEDTDLPMLRRYVEKVDLDPVDITFPDFPDTN